MTFYKKIIIFSIAISIIPLLVMGVFILYYAKARIEKEAINKINLICDLKIQKLEEYFTNKKKAADFYRQRYAVISLVPYLKSQPGGQPQSGYMNAKNALDTDQESFLNNFGFESVAITNTNGKVIYVFPENATSLKKGEVVADVTSAMFKDDPDKIYFSDMYRSRDDKNGYRIRLYSLIYDDRNGVKEVLGTAVLTLNMSHLFEFIQDTKGMGSSGETLLGKLYPSGEKDIMAGERRGYALFLNTLRFDSAAALNRKAYIGAAGSLPIQKAVSGENGSGVSVDYRKKPVIAAWRYIPSLEWGLVAKVDMDEVFNTVYGLMVELAVMISIIAVIILALGSYTIKRIRHSMDNLRRCVEEIGRGNLDCRINSDADDEIGQISRFFDRMAADLKHTTTSVESLTKEINERKKLEISLKDKMKELEIFNKAAVDRELRMVELKEKIRELERKIK